MSEEGVVIKGHLGVEGDQGALAGQHQRIDFQQRGVEGDECLAESPEELLGVPPAFGRQIELRGQQPGLVGPQAAVGIERLGKDQFRGLGGNLLDVHAPCGAGDEHRGAGGPVNEDRTIEFPVDGTATLDEDLPDGLALGSGLDRHQRLLKQALGDPGGVLSRLGQFHASLLGPHHLALAAAPGMDLGLNGTDGRAQSGECGGSLGGGTGDLAIEHRHPGGPEQVFCLEFVDFHSWLSWRSETPEPTGQKTCSHRPGRQYGTKAPPFQPAQRILRRRSAEWERQRRVAANNFVSIAFFSGTGLSFSRGNDQNADCCTPL